MKKILNITLLAILAAGFNFSCTKKDEPTMDFWLVGNWKIDSFFVASSDFNGASYYQRIPLQYPKSFTFKGDFSFIDSLGNNAYNGIWSRTDSTVQLTTDEGPKKCKILKLDNTNFTLRWDDNQLATWWYYCTRRH